MPKTTLEQWDETAANNTDMGGIDLSENVMRPPAVNNEMREHMAQVAKWLGDDTLASASTTDLGSVPGRYVSITGTTTITAFGTIKAGTIKYVKFAGILTLTHNGTSLILPGGVDVTTAAGDVGVFVSEGSGNWRCVAYERAAQVPALRAWEQIGGEVILSGATDYDWTGLNAYRRLRLTGVFAPVNASNLSLRIGSGTVLTANYDHIYAVSTSGSVSTATTGGDSAWLITHTTAAGSNVAFSCEIENFNKPRITRFYSSAAGPNGSGSLTLSNWGGQQTDGTAMDLLQVRTNGGNISFAELRLEGLRG
jgi:hypothetical protein